ncbi:ABC transporter ATP-binding protein [Corynebacterium sp. SCR221107]|nr:ABC transporter ATP-binding protein [Corynebacterium sp. SCR221107]WBT10052.1 ABC transporter ATP-binding protein [Corynebacterium sp. SCR221107]
MPVDSRDSNQLAPALVIKDLVKTYGNKQAVAGLSLSVQRGEILAFLGPNGAGKTTTIEICEGFTKATSGQVRVLGIDPSQHPDEVRRRIGIMLQGGGSYSGIKVGEMIKLAASYNENSLDPEWLLKLVALENVRNTTYRRLSGGQQQRLSLALALIGRPELVFLDEPTAGLDAQSRLLVWKIIEKLREDGVTVVLTTHLMDEAQALADRVAIIDHGKLVAWGTIDELRNRGAKTHHLNFSTATALDLSQDFTFEGSSIAGLHTLGVAERRPLTYTSNKPATPALITAIATAAKAQDVLITNLDSETSSLEDVFLDITGRSLRS